MLGQKLLGERQRARRPVIAEHHDALGQADVSGERQRRIGRASPEHLGGRDEQPGIGQPERELHLGAPELRGDRNDPYACLDAGQGEREHLPVVGQQDADALTRMHSEVHQGAGHPVGHPGQLRVVDLVRPPGGQVVPDHRCLARRSLAWRSRSSRKVSSRHHPARQYAC